jgi:hypothetical protein
MSSRPKWQDILSNDPDGSRWLDNFEHDVTWGNIPAPTVRKFLDNVESALAARTPNATEIFKAIVVIIKGDPVSYDLQGLAPAFQRPYSRVLEVDDYALYNVDLAAAGIEISPQTVDYVWDNLHEITPDYHKGYMMTTRKFFWATLRSRLENLNNVVLPGTVASEVRDCLGLAHVAANRRLLRVDIPPDLLMGKRVRAPTSFDASQSGVFLSAKDPNGQGWALHLRSWVRCGEEFVIEVLNFTDAFHVSKIGVVMTPPPRAIDWAKVKSHYP